MYFLFHSEFVTWKLKIFTQSTHILLKIFHRMLSEEWLGHNIYKKCIYVYVSLRLLDFKFQEGKSFLSISFTVVFSNYSITVLKTSRCQ